MSDFIWAAKANDIPSGEGRVCEVNGVAIALFNVDGTFHALDNTCIHRGGPLGDGICTDGTVTCPWHGWEYDVTDGQHQSIPALKHTSIQVRIVDGVVQLGFSDA